MSFYQVIYYSMRQVKIGRKSNFISSPIDRAETRHDCMTRIVGLSILSITEVGLKCSHERTSHRGHGDCSGSSAGGWTGLVIAAIVLPESGITTRL